MKAVEEKECLLNKLKEIVKQVARENGQKAKPKCFKCGKVISKETVRRHGTGQTRSHQQDDVPLQLLRFLVYTTLKRVVPRELAENLRIARIIVR